MLRWLQAHVWPRALSLMLFPEEAASFNGGSGEPPADLMEGQQAAWEDELAGMCTAFAAVMDACLTVEKGPPDGDAVAAVDSGREAYLAAVRQRLPDVLTGLAQELAARLGAVAAMEAAAAGMETRAAPAGGAECQHGSSRDSPRHPATPPGPQPSASAPSGGMTPDPPSCLLVRVVGEGLRLACRLGSVSGRRRGGRLVPRVLPLEETVPALGGRGVRRLVAVAPEVVARKRVAAAPAGERRHDTSAPGQQQAEYVESAVVTARVMMV
ncbi:hypothetical protein GPECTOR_67g313 [Gonium pectorale]|uniref:Uncharacterized protein n=1 Tax=Gonium pectorale TaxID=33097 RepID=A0A150G3W9_GONPE|nr:hypothetical protein GPECTOR_67g313 [Gonium pectorale]|eukprot:KXZ44473.1 hypothetical protein GPECTOR_67g313 [Gonium pectorale]